MLDQQQVVQDWMLAAQETIFVLQAWLGQLEWWQSHGRAEPVDFAEACLQLQEAGLWEWASAAGGHGVEALAEVLDVNEVGVNLVAAGYREGRDNDMWSR